MAKAADAVDDVEQDIDRDAGYDHDAASEVQTAVAELQTTSEEIAERTGEITELARDQSEQMDTVSDELSDPIGTAWISSLPFAASIPNSRPCCSRRTPDGNFRSTSTIGLSRCTPTRDSGPSSSPRSHR